MRLYVDCTTLASILLLFTVRCPVHGCDVLEQQTPYVKLYFEEVVYSGRIKYNALFQNVP